MWKVFLQEFLRAGPRMFNDIESEAKRRVAQVKAKYEKEVVTLQRRLTEARAELNKRQMLVAGNEVNRGG